MSPTTRWNLAALSIAKFHLAYATTQTAVFVLFLGRARASRLDIVWEGSDAFVVFAGTEFALNFVHDIILGVEIAESVGPT